MHKLLAECAGFENNGGGYTLQYPPLLIHLPPLGVEARWGGGTRACHLQLYQHFYMIPRKHARPQGAITKTCSFPRKQSINKKKKSLEVVL